MLLQYWEKLSENDKFDSESKVLIFLRRAKHRNGQAGKEVPVGAGEFDFFYHSKSCIIKATSFEYLGAKRTNHSYDVLQNVAPQRKKTQN